MGEAGEGGAMGGKKWKNRFVEGRYGLTIHNHLQPQSTLHYTEGLGSQY